MRIGYDIDGVLADFKHGLIQEAQYMDNVHAEFPDGPNTWVDYMPKGFNQVFDRVKMCPSFWLNLPVREEAIDHMESMHTRGVDRYVTARPIEKEVVEEWLRRNNFPEAPVIVAENKVPHMEGLDFFIEDNFSNWIDINTTSETTCLLLRTSSNNARINKLNPAFLRTVFDYLVDIDIYFIAEKIKRQQNGRIHV